MAITVECIRNPFCGVVSEEVKIEKIGQGERGPVIVIFRRKKCGGCKAFLNFWFEGGEITDNRHVRDMVLIGRKGKGCLKEKFVNGKSQPVTRDWTNEKSTYIGVHVW